MISDVGVNPVCVNLDGGCVVGLKRLFPIVVAYDDFLAGAQAMRAYDLLAENLGSDFDFRISLWKLGILNNADLLRIAVEDAANAGMVIICLHRELDLSAAARRWMESWLPAKREHCALFALLGHEKNAAPSNAEAYLKKAASDANMDFLLQRFQPMHGAGLLSKESHHGVPRRHREAKTKKGLAHDTQTCEKTHPGPDDRRHQACRSDPECD